MIQSSPFMRQLRQRGISLIEMMVGIAIGMMCVLIVMQMLSSFEGRKRTTSSGNDAQTIGTLGSFALDRDLRLAGYGFGLASDQVMGCNVVAFNSALASPGIDFSLRPVEILPGASGDKPDTIRVLYGNSPYFVSVQSVTGSASDSKTLQKSRDGFQVGDKVVVSGNTPTDCQLVEITGYADSDTMTFQHGDKYTEGPNKDRGAKMNPTGGTGTKFNKGAVYNLGPSPVQQIWTVDTAKHTLTRYNRLEEDVTNAADVATDVVNLKAIYGVDNNSDGKIGASEWVRPGPATVIADWTKVRAVRFALLVRSRQFERPNGDTPVTPSAPRWFDGVEYQAFQMNNVDGTTDSGASAVNGADAANNWRNYRYRVYENVVPLRNMIWGTAT